MSRPPTCLRLPDSLLERIEAYAKANRISFSAAARINLQRGLAVSERESGLVPPLPRRTVISKGDL
jgi:hypothetical protein